MAEIASVGSTLGGIANMGQRDLAAGTMGQPSGAGGTDTSGGDQSSDDSSGFDQVLQNAGQAIESSYGKLGLGESTMKTQDLNAQALQQEQASAQDQGTASAIQQVLQSLGGGAGTTGATTPTTTGTAATGGGGAGGIGSSLLKTGIGALTKGVAGG